MFWLVEVSIVLLAWHFLAKGLVALASAHGVTLPEMPLLKHVYIQFGVVILLCAWLLWRGESLSEFGLIKPTQWLKYIGQGILIFFACMLWDSLGRPIVDPIVASATGTGTHLAEQHFAPLRSNFGLLLYLIPVGWIVGGFSEEFLNRGFIMTRIAQILGETRWAWAVAIVLQAIFFGLGHAYQGPVGIVGIAVGSLITGTAFLLCGRNLWPLIIAHSLQDTLGFWAIYAGIAHG